MNQRTLLMVPGYNEPPLHFEILQKGRGAIAGLEAHGFQCLSAE